MDDQSVDVQRLSTALAAAELGDAAAASDLFAMLYRELRRLAKRQLHVNAAPGLTLGATTLLHEAYLDMAGRGAVFPDQARFFVYAARTMRGLIIDYVRGRRALKRGAEFHVTSLHTDDAASVPEPVVLTRLDEALEDLAHAEPALAELVDLKYFCGFRSRTSPRCAT
jgi:RNA polymerase sigma factor (TIGR02999 family)